MHLMKSDVVSRNLSSFGESFSRNWKMPNDNELYCKKLFISFHPELLSVVTGTFK